MKQQLYKFLGEFEECCENCGRRSEDIEILFATKYINPFDLAQFIGIAHERLDRIVTIGENRVQAAEEKLNYINMSHPDLKELFKVVMIGNLQTNKINKAIEVFEEIHAIDSIKLAQLLDTKLQVKSKKMRIFLEVNVSGERTKHGLNPEELDKMIVRVGQLKNLELKGLMTMAPYEDNLEKIRVIFRKLKQLANTYQLKTSMGMSHDWKVAVEEGSDMVRIGSHIFNSGGTSDFLVEDSAR